MAMNIGKYVGQRIKNAREARGLTQNQLASLMGKSVETISNFERGKVVTSLMTLGQLAQHLNIPVKSFFEDVPLDMSSSDAMSDAKLALRNAIDLLAEDDLEILAALADVLERRHRHKSN